MRVLFVSSEVHPFAQTGGLAYVSQSLPRALSQLGAVVETVMPMHRCVDTEKHRIKSTGRSVEVEIGAGRFEFELWKSEDDVNTYFLRNEELFGRDYLYSTPEGDYPDNDIRFGAFCWAVVELLKEGILKPSIVHTNDWQTALIPFLVKRFSLPVKTIHTIHNLAYQGVFPPETIDRLSIGREHFHMEAFEFWGKVNLLKAGIVFADAVSTVSPTYAREITTPEFGCGLEGVLKKHSYKLFGILNGIDYELWNPETDPHIYVNYTDNSIRQKRINKGFFLKDIGFNNYRAPLLVFIGRLTRQKGIEILIKALEKLSGEALNFTILGVGNENANRAILELGRKCRNVYVSVKYDEPLSRKMYASADFLLMPSLFEPCGLNQMIAMRYGTLVVARQTGGLADTVKDIEKPGGYGFLFKTFSPQALLEAIRRAEKTYRESRTWLEDVRKSVMRLDFSWNASAMKYMRLYENLLEGKIE